jgi:uncharacterized membrane protein (UPF0182 family)
MRDLFDEFMDELRRKQAELEGRDPDAPRGEGDQGGGDQGGGDDGGGDDGGGDDSGGAGPDDEGSPRSRDETADDEPPIERVPPRPVAGSGGTRRPPPRRRRDEAEPPSVRRVLGWVLGLTFVVLLFLLVGPGIDLITDAMWYRSVGFESVFWTRLGTEAWLFIGILVVALVVLFFNLYLAGRLAPPRSATGGTMRGLFDRLAEAASEASERGRGGWDGGPFAGPSDRRQRPRTVVIEAGDLPDLTPFATIALGILAVVIALGLAAAAASAWETILLWRNQVTFASTGTPVTDPVFGRDIGFFLFELPFLRLVQSLFNGLVLGSLLVVGGRYLAGALRGGGLVFSTPVRVHLGVLGGLYLISVAIGYQLDKFELSYSQHDVFSGVSYTDQAARFFALDVLTIVAALAAALLVGGAFTRFLWPLGGALVVWFAASVVLGTIYPEIVQRFVVTPDPYSREEPYIRNNIAMTRLAYDLEGWERRDYGGERPLTEEAIQAEIDTFRNARLWDYRPLGTTIDQLQTVRRYYDFFDVDVDRYTIGDRRRQVMLSARELDLTDSGITENWLNTRIIYTHGIGLVMTPVNEVVGQGQPRLWIRDLPPISTDGAPEISQPRVYFGEIPSDYVILNARQAEFDYPSGVGGTADPGGDSGAEYRWTGTSGIRLDTTLVRLLFGARFRDLNLLISDQVTNESQLLFHRSIGDRLPRIAPFLRYDKDPYLVATGDGRLVYIQDAFTTSDRFPHAEYFFPVDSLPSTNLGRQPFNYIRNSVKIVVDAYEGTTTFYVADPDDPIVRAYQGVFPELFRPLSELSSDLAAHLRVPEEQFNVQTRVFGQYHVTDPLTFFRREDLWQVPAGQSTAAGSLPNEAYYVIMRMPGEEAAEFLLLQPMVPTARPNMISWVAARMDDDRFGQVRAYQFPANTTVFGPEQVEALIDQDPIISSQFSLWDRAGSEVIRGNLLVVPVQDSIIYLQPVYLQSTGSSFPEFQRIVVASPTEVVWAETLDEALRLLLEAQGGPAPSPSPGPTPSPGPSPSPAPSPSVGPAPSPPSGDVAALIEYANLHFELAQEALRDGDFATYGAEIELVEEALRELGALVGSPAPSP